MARSPVRLSENYRAGSGCRHQIRGLSARRCRSPAEELRRWLEAPSIVDDRRGSSAWRAGRPGVWWLLSGRRLFAVLARSQAGQTGGMVDLARVVHLRWSPQRRALPSLTQAPSRALTCNSNCPTDQLSRFRSIRASPLVNDAKTISSQNEGSAFAHPSSMLAAQSGSPSR